MATFVLDSLKVWNQPALGSRLSEEKSQASTDKLAVYATPPTSPARRTPVTHPLPEAFVLGRMSGMEGDEQQRRQYEQQQFQRGYAPGFRPNIAEANPPDRFRQAQMMTGRSPTAAGVVSPTGANTQELGNFGYPQGPPYPPTQLQGSSMHFPTDYSQDSQRSQHFPQYASQMVYNVPQQNQPRSPYDTMPQYQPRQSAALEVLSSQFGVPQYYNPNEPVGGSGHTSTPQQYAPSQFNQPIAYQASGMGRNTNPSPYPVDMAEYAQGTAAEGAEPQEREASDFAEDYDIYQEALRDTFEHTSKVRLAEAGQSLEFISEWLLGHFKELGMATRERSSSFQADLKPGLATDNQSKKEERLKLWKEFNTCWLATLQCQKETTLQMLETGQRPPHPQSVIQKAVLERMGEALVQNCDELEKYGLVDYEMGVWEEEIMSILSKCLDLLEADVPQPSQGQNVDPQIQGA
ncbi:MAG: hypothetical protein Q9209_002245 [Squamulea sp. 1 TL-2023]